MKKNQAAKLTSFEQVRNTLPNRKATGHKGSFGTSLLIAGTDEMPGSVTLSAIGAIRSGVGRLVVATTNRALPIVANHVPEATFLINGFERIRQGEIPRQITAIGIGPGLPNGKATQEVLERLLEKDIPLVVDAGALAMRKSWEAKGPIIITPHPGEFSRMTGYSTAYINENRNELSLAYAKEYRVIVVLKGKDTVIAFPDGSIYHNPTGNTSLAKGGSGDVLTGIMTSFLATHKKVEHAVVNAVYVHGYCADLWAEEFSEASMAASDFAELLPKAMKRLEKN